MSGFYSPLTTTLGSLWTAASLVLNSSLTPLPRVNHLVDTIAAPRAPKCVHIYYDKVPSASPRFDYGRVHALFLQNLISHFPNIQQYVIPVESYEKGQLDQCQANFYLGNYFDNTLPEDFLKEFQQSHAQNVWMGYNLWKFSPPELAAMFGIEYLSLSELDWNHLDAKGEPGFFRTYEYKGEQFEKISRWNNPKDPSTFQAAFEILILKPLTQPPAPQVISWAKHSTRAEKVPHILKKGNFWLVAESPFSFIHLGDRYLIFADVLFDILDEKPLYPNKKPALVRFEDIHVKLPEWQWDSITKVIKNTHIAAAISLIPIFADPLQYLVTDPGEKRIPATQNPKFVSFLKNLENSGSAMLWHGVTHQFGEIKNPATGMSGADCEFWDCTNNQPLREDSPAFVVNRLEEGLTVFEQAGLKIGGWLTPHYSSSALDNVVFGQLFDWNVGRENYSLITQSQKAALPTSLNLQQSTSAQNGQRLSYFQDLMVNVLSTETAPQFLPYESYGDAFGIRLVPETSGFIQPTGTPEIGASISVDQMLQIIKRNRVLRDVWASFFLHPFLFNDKANGGLGQVAGDTKEIERLIESTKRLGYEFVNLNEWRKSHSPVHSLPVKEVF